MTAPTAPDLSCPGCHAALGGAAACPSCGLPLVGPAAARLWEVDLALAELGSRRTALLAERGRLLHTLRAAAPAGAPAGGGPSSAHDRTAPAHRGSSLVPRRAHPAGAEWSPRRVQNLLLSLGALLLAVAATVFAAVTYDRLGVGGRAAVLLGLTGLAAAAAPHLRTRGLVATAESLAAVALALAALDAWGLRRLGLGADLELGTWLPVTSAALAALAAGYAVATGLRAVRLGSLALAHVAALLAVARLEPSVAETSLLLTLLAAVHVVAVAALVDRDRTAVVRDLLGAAAVGAVLTGCAGLAAALVSVPVDGSAAVLPLAASALLAAGGAVAVRPGRLQTALAAVPVVLLAGAAVVAAVERDVARDLLPLAALAVALAGLGTAALLPRRPRTGVVGGAAAVAAAAVVAVAEPLTTGLLGPLTWLVDPWSLPAGADARSAVSPTEVWEGSAAAVGVLVLVAAGAAAAGAVLGRARAGAALAAGTALLAALLAPLAVDGGHRTALLWLLLLAAGLAVAADRLRDRGGEVLLAAAAAPAVLAAGWSLADRSPTLVVLPVVAFLLAGVAARRWSTPTVAGAVGGAGLFAAAALGATAVARGLAAEQTGGLLLVVPGALLALSCGLPAGAPAACARRAGAHAAAVVVAAAAVLLAVGDVGWLSWTLAATGLLALVTALEPARRRAAPVGGLLLTASSWVRLADAGIGAPEPYVLPLAGLALGLGHLRLRRQPTTSSHAAYGPGLALLLLPSLLAALSGTGLARPLLLGAVALGVLLVGAAARLQAPLLLGGGTLAVLALDLLAPYATAVPRWTALAAAGTLLVVVGATFEQRLRELGHLRDRYARLR